MNMIRKDSILNILEICREEERHSASETAKGRVDEWWDYIVKNVQEIPGVDIVRCKDCEHSWTNENGKRFCQKSLGGHFCVIVGDYSFCSNGKKKDGGDT